MSVGAYDLVILNPKETAPALRAEEYLVLPKYLPYVQILVPYNPEAFTDVVKNPTETGEWYKAPFDEGGIPEEYWQALNAQYDAAEAVVAAFGAAYGDDDDPPSCRSQN